MSRTGALQSGKHGGTSRGYHAAAGINHTSRGQATGEEQK